MDFHTSSHNHMNVCAYCRVSTAALSQQDSYHTQVDYYTRLIHSTPGWSFAGIYSDEGISGTSMKNRSGFLKLMVDCNSGKIDKIIVKSITRFARNTLDCLHTVRSLRQLGVSIWFENENIDTGDLQSEVFLTMLSSIAQEESLNKSLNYKWRVQKNFAHGFYRQSTMPFGYSRKDGATFVPDNRDAATVNHIFNEYLNGASLLDIANQLNQRGVHSPEKTNWRPQQVKNILLNERYIGDMRLQKKYTDKNYNRRINYGAFKQYYICRSHPPIVDKTAFDKTQVLLNARGNKALSRPHKPHPLSKKIKCGICGNTYVRRKNGNTVFWCCNKNIGSACKNKCLKEQDIAYCLYQLTRKLAYDNYSVLTAFDRDLNRMLHVGRDSSRLHMLEKQEHFQLNQMKALNSLWAAEKIDYDSFLMHKGYLDKQLQTLATEKKLPPVESRCSSYNDLASKNRTILEALQSTIDIENSAMPINYGLLNIITAKMTVLEEKNIRFELINGLAFTERAIAIP